VEVPAEVGDGFCGYGDVAVVESGQGSEHGGQDRRVESGVDLGCAFEQESDVVALCDVVDIGEVAGFGAVEEGEQFPACEFFECERGAGDACFRWQVRWGVEGEVLTASLGEDDRVDVA